MTCLNLGYHMKKLFLIYSTFFIGSLLTMDNAHNRDISKKRAIPETELDESIEKKIKNENSSSKLTRTCNPASLLDIASLNVSRFISAGKISMNEFETKVTQDIHHRVKIFQAFKNNLRSIVTHCIIGRQSPLINSQTISGLLDLGANPNRKNPSDQSLLLLAISKGNIEHINALSMHSRTDLENKCSFKSVIEPIEETPLITAIFLEKGLPIIKVLVQYGANVNTPSQYFYKKLTGNPALKIVCENSWAYKKEEHFEIMKFLLDNGANPYSVNINTVPQAYREDTLKMVQKYYHS